MPIFLTRAQVERLHDEALRRWGGSAGIGVFARSDPWPNIAGYLLRPIIESSGASLIWFWFSRYAQELADPDLSDIEPRNFSKEFYWNIRKNGELTLTLLSFRLRYSLRPNDCEIFEKAAQEIILRHSCIARYFREWASDLGGSRFTSLDDRRTDREQIILALVNSASRLVLHSLISSSEQGDYSFEKIAFDVPHHLVSNIMGKPG